VTGSKRVVHWTSDTWCEWSEIAGSPRARKRAQKLEERKKRAQKIENREKRAQKIKERESTNAKARMQKHKI
jgi:hypothetical protein